MSRCISCMQIDPHNTNICPLCGQDQTVPPREAYHLKPKSMLQGRYFVGKVLGYGGFGVTYIGFDEQLERTVAIKEFLPTTFATRMPGDTHLTVYNNATSPAQFDAGLKRFVEEAQTLAQFNGIKGIVDIYDTFLGNNTAYIVMQFLKGQDVKHIVNNQGALEYEMARGIVLSVCDTLIPVHAKNIIHRDISPDNIFITDEGEVKLLDFGAARYESAVNSKSLSVILKSGYAPEEQYRSKGEQGAWTDVYALSATFYKMLTGRTVPDSMERAINDEIIEPSKLGANIPTSAENAMLNALQVRKTDRIKSVQEFKDQLLADGVQRVVAKKRKEVKTGVPLFAKLLIAASLLLAAGFGIFVASGGLMSDEVAASQSQETIYVGGTMLEDNYGSAEELLAVENDYVIQWVDPVVEQHVRVMLAKPQGDIMYSDVHNISNLDLNTRNNSEEELNVKSLEDIRHFTNLKELDCSNNEISDLSPLAAMSGLTSLDIYKNLVTDLTPILGLDNLVDLSLTENFIADVSVVGEMEQLTNLYIGMNGVNDISFVAQLVNLENFGNHNSDYSAEEYGYAMNTIADITPLTGLEKLQGVNFTQSPMTDYSPLAQLTGLSYIGIHDCGITDISFVSGMTELDSVDFYENNIYDVSPLANLQNIQYITLSYNESLSDVSSLAALPAGAEVVLHGTAVSDVSMLDHLIVKTD